MMERLKQRRVLEDLRDFLSPVKLPAPLTIKLEGCGADSELFTSSGTPRAAARVILMPATGAASPRAAAPLRWPAWAGPASVMIERLPDGVAVP